MRIQELIFAVAILLAGLAAAGPGCNSQDSTGAKPDSSAAEIRPIQLTIEFGEQKDSVTGSIEYSENLTVLDLLRAVASEKGVSVELTGKGETAFVTSIDGFRGGQDGNEFWVYLVNDKLANEGCGAFVINSGDRVIWRMGKYLAAEE